MTVAFTDTTFERPIVDATKPTTSKYFGLHITCFNPVRNGNSQMVSVCSELLGLGMMLNNYHLTNGFIVAAALGGLFGAPVRHGKNAVISSVPTIIGA